MNSHSANWKAVSQSEATDSLFILGRNAAALIDAAITLKNGYNWHWLIRHFRVPNHSVRLDQ
jgi:hypothetical protein